MKYKYILFDLDGTITESGPGIMNSVEYALNKMNREVGERDTLKKFIGPPLTESMEKYYGMSEEEALIGVKYDREYYAVKGIFENSVYEGLAETLESLNLRLFSGSQDSMTSIRCHRSGKWRRSVRKSFIRCKGQQKQLTRLKKWYSPLQVKPRL